MKLFFIQTFGCQMNINDSEKVASLLINNGWTQVEEPKKADLIIINSCSVREKPLQKLFSFAGKFVQQKKQKNTAIFIMGCVAQQMGENIIKKAPYIDGVFGPGSEYLIPDIAEKRAFPFVSTDKDLLERKELFPNSANKYLPKTFSSQITIMHGCNNFCSYCIVPFVRGREVSRTREAIMEEINALIDNGVKEITLLGQNVNSYYDAESNTGFADLLYWIAEKTSLKRLRFVTSHPKDFTKELAMAFKNIDILMPYLHLPAQSGSSEILKLMNRGYTIEEYKEKLALARYYVPDISLSSDFIVGFPGETESYFEKTVSLVEEIGFDSIFAFAYSARPLTKAASFKDTVSESEKLARLNYLLERQKIMMKKMRSRFLGRVVEVLVEDKSHKGETFSGRSEHNQIVHIKGSSDLDLGTIQKVKIEEVLENTLRGEKV